MPNFDVILELRRSYVQRLLDELQETAGFLVPTTLDQIAPFEVAEVEVRPVVNLPDSILPLEFLPDRNAVEVLIEQAEVQLLVDGEVDGERSLYEMRGDLRIELEVERRSEDDRVRIGFDNAAVTPERVTVSITTGHPLADDDLLIDLMNRLIHLEYFLDDIPAIVNVPENPDDPPLGIPGFPATVAAFIRVMNEDGGDPARTIRVANAPGVDRLRLIVPVEVWANLMPDADPSEVQAVQFTADLEVEFDVVRSLGAAPAFIEARIADGDPQLANLVPIEGEETLENPIWRAALEAFVREQGVAILGGLGNLRVPAITLVQLEVLLSELVSGHFQSDARFIPFWDAAQSADLRDVTPRVLADALAVGINAREGADIDQVEDFIPVDRDFAVELAPDFFLANLERYLNGPDEYDDVAGGLRLAGDHAAGADTIAVAGFTNETGVVRSGTLLTIDGSGYRVTADADVDDSAADLPIEPDLFRDAADGEPVDFEPGFGLPRTFDAGGNDWTVRIDDLDPVLEDGRIRLSGPFRFRRPHAVIRNIFGTIGLNMGFRWTGAAQVEVGGQSGDTLRIEEFSLATRRVTESSIIVVDGIEQPLLVTDDAEVSEAVGFTAGGRATLEITPDLPESPAAETMVLLKWLGFGRVDGAQTGTVLRIDGVSEGRDLIPQGVKVRVGGREYSLRRDAEIEDGSATLRLEEELEDDLEDGTEVSFFGGWWGRAASEEIEITPGVFRRDLDVRGITRTVPGHGVLAVDGINGVFPVGAEVDVVDDAAVVPVTHSVIDSLTSLGELEGPPDDIWELLGQPADGAAVRIRVSREQLLPELLGDPSIELDTNVEGIFGFLLGFFVSIFHGSSFLGVVVGTAIGLLTRSLVRALGGTTLHDRISRELVAAPLPETLEEIDLAVDSHFNNPIVISPEGVRLAGSAIPSSTYPEIAESRARANGPYHFTAGLEGSYGGGTDAPRTEYIWRSGDGQVLSGLSPSHTYPRRGLYVADLTSVDSQWGFELQTRHLAAVSIHNTPPELGPLPVLRGNEGEEVELSASFTDVAWLDSHRAFVDFGDGSLPVEAEVTETLGEPATSGRLRAVHTYCDNGTFPVTVILQDRQGGAARRSTEALIVNVPPVVEAGADLFTHPCTPLRLAGYFEDQGWCDTHTGVWDFGDCSPPFPTTIVETHQPPKATGWAIATHCYERCGSFLATLTVRDDDGGEASDSLVVRYSDLVNGDFETGFALDPLGRVGSGWTAYGLPLTSTPGLEQVFHCESCLVCSGQRAQAVVAPVFEHAGIRQQLGVNPGWEYQIVATVSVPPPGETEVWLGADPLGGGDRAAPSVAWSRVAARDGWQRLSVRTVAAARRLTVFLEARAPGAQPVVFDCVRMQAHPCLPALDPEEPPAPVHRCVGWSGIDPVPQLGSSVARGGFTFHSLAGTELTIAHYGSPLHETKLALPDRETSPGGPNGLRIDWEGEASRVEARVAGPPGSRITLTALDAVGGALGEDSATQGDLRTLAVAAPGIEAAELRSDYRGTLIELCTEAAGLSWTAPRSTCWRCSGPAPGSTSIRLRAPRRFAL